MQREAKVSSFPSESLSTQQGSVEDKGSRALQEAAELSTTCGSAAQVGPKKSFFAKEVIGTGIPADCWEQGNKV